MVKTFIAIKYKLPLIDIEKFEWRWCMGVPVELNIDSYVVTHVLNMGSCGCNLGIVCCFWRFTICTLDWVFEVHHSHKEANLSANVRASITCLLVTELMHYMIAPDSNKSFKFSCYVGDCYSYDHYLVASTAFSFLFFFNGFNLLYYI
jgi:ABC-type transport system involved in Fe-S cluster assembly fused permease/ATPase subunit